MPFDEKEKLEYNWDDDHNMFNSSLVGNLQPFPNASQSLLPSSQLVTLGKSSCATSKLPIFMGLPMIFL
jgi:hypothetical protein